MSRSLWLNQVNRLTDDEKELLQLIYSDDLDRFEELLKKVKAKSHLLHSEEEP
jgi:hypothetical protein